MNRLLRVALISFISFAFNLSLVGFVLASNNQVTIIPAIIFEIENLTPGDVVQREVIIQNNSENKYDDITLSGIRISNDTGPDLAKMIDLQIKKGGEIKDINLANILNQETIFLPDSGIEGNQKKNYQFTAKLRENVGNKYQNKNIGFDFIFTFRGTQNGKEIVEIVRVSGGGVFLLNILNEEVEEIGEDRVTVTWNTNYLALGKIVYDTSPGQFNFNEGEPSYGYAFFSPTTKTRTTSHSITLVGLNPGTTYYYRIVSYASLAISVEHEFTTPRADDQEIQIVEGVTRERSLPTEPDVDLDKEIDSREDQSSYEGESESEKMMGITASLLGALTDLLANIPANTLLAIAAIIILFFLIDLIIFIIKEKNSN